MGDAAGRAVADAQEDELSRNDADETTEDTENTEEKRVICKDADRKPNGVG